MSRSGLAFACLVLSVACLSCAATSTVVGSGGFHVVGLWVGPEETEYMREDGLGPFPPAWPAAAFVIKSEVQEDFDATFCLLVGPDLNADNALERFPEFIRFANVCRDADLRGRWVWFDDPHPLFVLVYDSGGTAGSVVELYARSMLYNWTTEYQSHSFARVLQTYSQGTPLVGDIDGDGLTELLTTVEKYGDKGAPDTYTIWDYRDGDFVEAGEVTAAQISDRPDITPL